MEVSKIYIVEYDNFLATLYLLKSGVYFISYKGRNGMALIGLSSTDAEKLIED